MTRQIIGWVLLFLAFATAGCSAVNAPALAPMATANAPIELTVAAAADLQFAFSELAAIYEAETDHKVTLVFGSTGQLAQQIENGAPYDLFAAANIEFIDQLVAKGLALEESQQLYARGRVVLAVNRAAGVTAQKLEDLVGPDIKYIAIANPEHAPYGRAAQQALEAAGVWEQIQPKLVFGENIRQALQFVQSGDAQVGIVALSVANVPEITWTLIDDQLHKPLDQALAVMSKSSHQDEALAFARFINSSTGRPIMQKYGFILPGEVAPTPVAP